MGTCSFAIFRCEVVNMCTIDLYPTFFGAFHAHFESCSHITRLYTAGLDLSYLLDLVFVLGRASPGSTWTRLLLCVINGQHDIMYML